MTTEVKNPSRALAEASRRARSLGSVPLDAASESRCFGDMRGERCVEKYEALCQGSRRGAAA